MTHEYPATDLRRRPRRRRRALALIGLVIIAMVIAMVVFDRSSDRDTVSPAPSISISSSPVPEPPPSPASPSESVSPTTSPSAPSTSSAASAWETSANCGSDPSSCGMPDETNTGVPSGVTLSVVTGDMTISTEGAVIDRKDIRGCITVTAANVTIKRSKITCLNFYVISSFAERYSGGGLLVEDVEIDCQNTNGTGIGSYGFTARRVNIHGCENGYDIDSDSTVTSSYTHDLYAGATGHTDGIQLAGGSHITITNNTLFNPGGTSAIISNPSKNSDVLVSHNLMAGGAYTLYCPKEVSSDYRVLNNRFSTVFTPKSGAYGPWVYCGKVASVSGNVWDSTLAAISEY